MLFKGLANSFIGIILGNLIGFFSSSRDENNLIWKSEPQYRQRGKLSLWQSFAFGIGFILVGLPWLTFIPSEPIFRIFASVFVSMGYFALTGFPLNFATLNVYNNRIEVKSFKQILLVIQLQDVIALIKVKSKLNSTDLLYKVRGKHKLLSLMGTSFDIPEDVLKSIMEIREIEINHIDDLWLKNKNVSFLDKIVSYLTTFINPLTALIAYIAIYGPFASFFTGILILELISILFTFIMNYFVNKYAPRLNDAALDKVVIES